MAGSHIVSTHLPPAKDRSLAAALIRMSERRGLQDDFIVEKVVYCGEEEPFGGWTNTVPTARYSESNRPKDITELPPKKRKLKPKVKPMETRDSMNDVYSELLGATSRADGHYHASATLQELYDEYKKRQRLEDHSKLKTMVDPITFRYIPINERTEDEDSDNESRGKLPVLKMTHANKQAKLLEVLESFMNRKSDDRGNRTDTEKYAIKGSDAASFYDKYRWYFKDKKGNLSRTMKIKKRKGRLGKRRGLYGTGSYNSETESEDSSGRRRRPRRHSHPPTYVIQVKDDSSKTLTQETITFERKVDYGLSAPGGPGIDRWVARVVIKDSVPRNEQDTNTSSTSFSQATLKSPRSQSQIDKLYELRTKRQNGQDQKNLTKQAEYRLGHKKSKKRNNRRIPANFYELYRMSSVEASKVSMKYNVPVGKRQGGGEASSDSSSEEMKVPQPKEIKKNLPPKRKLRPAPVHPQKHMDPGGQLEPRAKKVLPLSKKSDDVEIPQEETKLPLPPIKPKRQPNYLSDNSSKSSKNKKKHSINADQTPKLIKEDKTLVSKKALESSEARQVKTPSSSTFNPDRMFQQMKDTADFITKASSLSKANKSIHSSPRFPSHIEDARTGDSSSVSKSDPSTRKPLHPKFSKNRVQDKIQQMIDDEKALVSQVIKQLNSSWKEGSLDREQIGSVSESVQDALSTAIAKARLSDLQALGNGLGPPPRSNNQVMKRRVVPPVKDKSSMPTTSVGSDERLFLTDSSAFLTTKPKLPAVKPSAAVKKSENRGSKSIRSLSKDRNDTFKGIKQQPGVKFVADGDLLITKPQKMMPGIFEASISSIKPARRIANVNQAFDIRQRA